MMTDAQRRDFSDKVGKIIVTLDDFPKDKIYISCKAPYDTLRLEAILFINFSTFPGQYPSAAAEVLDYGESISNETLDSAKKLLETFASKVSQKLNEGKYDHIIGGLFRTSMFRPDDE
jgi:hypothetical protein